MAELINLLKSLIKAIDHMSISIETYFETSFGHLIKKLEKFEDRLETKFNKIYKRVQGESEYVLDEISHMLKNRMSNFVADTNMNQIGAIIENISYDIATIGDKISEQEHSNRIITNSCKYMEEAINELGNAKNIDETAAYSPKPSQKIFDVDNGFMNDDIDNCHKKVVHTHRNLKFRYSKHINYNIIDLDYLLKNVPWVQIEQIKNWTAADHLFKKNGRIRIPVGKCIITVAENHPSYGTQTMEFIVYRKLSGMAYLSRKSYSELIHSPFF